MLKHILKHDWRLLTADKVLWLASLLIVLCVSYAVYNGATRAERWRNDVSQQIAKAQAGVLEQKAIVENILSGKKSADEYPWDGFPQNAQQAATLPPGMLGRFSLWMLIATAYALFWFVLAAAVNALGRSSEANATVLTCLWLAFVLIIPAILNLAVTAASPVPSRMQYVSSLRAAENAATQIGNKLLASYYSDHPDLSANGVSAVPEWARKYFLVQREIEDKTTSILTDYESRLDRQQALAQKISFSLARHHRTGSVE